MHEISRSRAFVWIGLLFSAGMSGGIGVGLWGAERANAKNAHLARFSQVFSQIERTHVDPVDPDQLVNAAIHGMLASVDEHARWMSAEQAEELAQHRDGTYDGIGVHLLEDQGSFRVVGVVPGSPAERAGLAAGDRIVAINGNATNGKNDVLTEQLDGPNGEEVVITIEREGRSLDLHPVRDVVQVPSVSAEQFGDVRYLRLSQFQRGSAEELDRALGQDPPYHAVILDLRDNPGGLLDEALGVADRFLAEGVLATARGRTKETEAFFATPSALPTNIPVAVLVNEMSASGSEIVAAALQDSKRATLFGQVTYGKGTVQSVFVYPDHSALKLTTGRYYTPSGLPVTAHLGRTPDHLVDGQRKRSEVDHLREQLTSASMPAEERSALLETLDRLPAPAAEPYVPWHLQGEARISADPQLRAALEWLRGGDR